MITLRNGQSTERWLQVALSCIATSSKFLLPLILLTSAFFSYGIDFDREREKLIKNHIIAEGIKDPLVIQSMRNVKREEFVPQELRSQAYQNKPLPIGHGQTISQPYIVALMTELLGVNGDDRVLEIGTGSGYQAAVLANIVEKVYTIEIIEPLGKAARERLKRLGYNNVEVKIGDGYFGWEENSPFDAIIVTAAADHIPPPLLKQLKNGGRMCIPVGQPYFTQVLKLVEKDEAGNIKVRDIIPVIFVPLTRAPVENE
jgi:protein-L-isoaspartate(D-aspartate) O-methyltransferase